MVIGGLFLMINGLQMAGTAWVKGIAQAVTNQVDEQDREYNEQTGEDPHPP